MPVHPFFALGRIAEEHCGNIADAGFAAFAFFSLGDDDQFITQAEGEAAQKRLMQMKQSLETRKQALTEQLMKEQETFNKDLKTRLDAYLEEYNKTKHYDYILSYSASGSSILYANKQLDITKDVVAGMNASAKSDANKK